MDVGLVVHKKFAIHNRGTFSRQNGFSRRVADDGTAASRASGGGGCDLYLTFSWSPLGV